MGPLCWVGVRISEEGALRNQRYAFTNTSRSRLRAVARTIAPASGASSNPLRRGDSGAERPRRQLRPGDFQKRLSFHQFGLGRRDRCRRALRSVSASQVYAATRCVVTSGGQRVDIDTNAARQDADVLHRTVPASEAINGTRVDLYAVDLGTRVEELCLGFPVAVLFNDLSLSGPWPKGTWPRRPVPSVRCTWRAPLSTASTATRRWCSPAGLSSSSRRTACATSSTSCIWTRASS